MEVINDFFPSYRVEAEPGDDFSPCKPPKKKPGAAEDFGGLFFRDLS